MSSTAPQPSLLFSFNGSNVDSITNLSPSSTTGTPSFVPGNYGSSIQLTNTQGSAPTTYLTYTTIPAISNAAGFTISFWLNSPSITSTSNCLGISASDDVFFQLKSSTAGFGGKNVTGTTAPSFTIPVNRWVNYALAVNPTSWNQYINGALQTTSGYTATSTSLTSISGPLTVGTTPTQTQGATISIQDLRIYNTALSAPQILGIYQSQGIPPRLTATSNVAQPALLFSFNSSNVDSINSVAPTTTNGTPTYNPQGKYGTSIVFNNTPGVGTNSLYYTTGVPKVTNFTICFWVKPLGTLPFNGTNNGDQEWMCFSTTGGATQNFFYIFTTYNTNYMRFTNNGEVAYFTNNLPIQVGVWYHVAVTLPSSGTAYFYFNGTQYSAGTPTSTYTLNNISVAKTPGGSGTSLGANCEIADLRVYTSILSAPQIFGIYQSQGIPPRMALTPSTGGLPNPNYAWNFDGTAIDSISGIVPTLANVNGVDTTGVYSTWANQLIYDSTAAKYGTAISLRNPNGPTITSNALYFRNTSGLSLPFGDTASSTVTFWVKFLDTRSGVPDNTILFLSRNSGQVTYYIANYGTTIGTYGSWQGPSVAGPNVTLTPVNGTWYHISLVITNTRSTMYLNGSAGTPVTYTAVAGGSSNVWNSLALASYDFGAAVNRTATSSIEIDDLRIYTQGLTPAQIQTIYQSGGNLYGATTVQPTYLWSFNGSNVDSISYVIPSTFTGCTYTPGRLAQALSIINTTTSGGTNSATYPVNVNDSGNLSFCFWVNIISNSLANTPTIFQFNVSTSGSTYLQLFLLGSPGNFFLQSSSPSSLNMNASLLPVNYGTWYHMAVVTNGSTLTWYINNIIYTQSGFTNPRSYTGNGSYATLNIGSATSGNGVANNMIINDFRIYNTALSAQQIQGIYLSGGAPPSAVLTSG